MLSLQQSVAHLLTNYYSQTPWEVSALIRFFLFKIKHAIHLTAEAPDCSNERNRLNMQMSPDTQKNNNRVQEPLSAFYSMLFE